MLKWVTIFISITAQASVATQNTLTAKIKNLKSDYVVVQVWSTFCAPCGEEVQELNKALVAANTGYSEKKLSVLGVPVQSRTKEIEAFIEHFKPNYEQLILESSETEFFLKDNKSLPLTLLFSGKERIKVKEWRVKINTAKLLKEIGQLDKNKKRGPYEKIFESHGSIWNVIYDLNSERSY